MQQSMYSGMDFIPQRLLTKSWLIISWKMASPSYSNPRLNNISILGSLVVFEFIFSMVGVFEFIKVLCNMNKVASMI